MARLEVRSSGKTQTAQRAAAPPAPSATALFWSPVSVSPVYGPVSVICVHTSFSSSGSIYGKPVTCPAPGDAAMETVMP